MQVAVERRPTLFFLLVMAALFIVMSLSARTRVGVVGETRTLFERAVMTVFSFVPKTVNAAGQSTIDIYHGYIDMRRSVAENLELKRKVAELTQKSLQLQKSHGDLSRMRAILGYTEQFAIPTVMAHVVMLETEGPFKSLILDRGSDTGISVNDTVVNANGLIGRVILTTKDLAKVQLVIDPNAAVGSLLDRTRRQGVVHGDGQQGLRMEYVASLSDVAIGDLILTAGIDGIHPKGIPVGRVTKVEEGKDLFKAIWVAPNVQFNSLEEVIVLRTRKIPPEVVRYAP